jgi:hypothetical protein
MQPFGRSTAERIYRACQENAARIYLQRDHDAMLAMASTNPDDTYGSSQPRSFNQNGFSD